MITVIDYSVGNLNSIVNMISKVGGKAQISSSKEEISKAEKLILPGVGSFNYGMEQLEKSGFIEVLNARVLKDKIPILGICLGAQLFTKGSEEGEAKGLGWFDVDTVEFKLSEDSNLSIPHMGWQEISIKKQSPLLKDLENESRFYFVHQYHFRANNPSEILTETNYGYNFVSSLSKDNIYGVQFHPEKSHKFGMKLMKNFLEL